jgi:hypothetical protein
VKLTTHFELFIDSSLALLLFVGLWSLVQFRNPVHSRLDSLDGGSARRKASQAE